MLSSERREVSASMHTGKASSRGQQFRKELPSSCGASGASVATGGRVRMQEPGRQAPRQLQLRASDRPHLRRGGWRAGARVFGFREPVVHAVQAVAGGLLAQVVLLWGEGRRAGAGGVSARMGRTSGQGARSPAHACSGWPAVAYGGRRCMVRDWERQQQEASQWGQRAPHTRRARPPAQTAGTAACGCLPPAGGAGGQTPGSVI